MSQESLLEMVRGFASGNLSGERFRMVSRSAVFIESAISQWVAATHAREVPENLAQWHNALVCLLGARRSRSLSPRPTCWACTTQGSRQKWARTSGDKPARFSPRLMSRRITTESTRHGTRKRR